MSDLETRVRDSLTDQARLAGEWRVPGEVLRGAAAARTSARRRSAAAATGGLLVVGLVAAAVVTGGGRDTDPPPAATDTPTASPTPSDTSTPVVLRPELLQVPVDDTIVQRALAKFGIGDAELLASAALPRSGDTVLVFRDEPGFEDSRVVVSTVTVHRGRLMAGTLAHYRSGDAFVAQPVRDGVASTLVVIAPPRSGADSVEVTTSRPGKDVQLVTTQLNDDLALVELPAPQSATRLRLLRQGSVLADRIPGDFYLEDSVPRPLGRVAAETEGYQPVQVRTDGQTACRFTAFGLDGPDAFGISWNPFDVACATIDREGILLLIAEDRRYSSVAGTVPPAAVQVRFTWQSGSDTDVTATPVRNPGDEVPAFIDESGHRPDQLVRAEALDASGDVVATAIPQPAGT